MSNDQGEPDPVRRAVHLSPDVEVTTHSIMKVDMKVVEPWPRQLDRKLDRNSTGYSTG